MSKKSKMTEHEKELYNIILSFNSKQVELIRCALKCITLFAIVWWLSYMFTPYLTKNYINNSKQVSIQEDS